MSTNPIRNDFTLIENSESINEPKSTRTSSSNNEPKLTRSHLTILAESNKETPSGFGNLPVKILKTIFQHFSETELIQTISPVCQRWRYAALQPDLWRNLRVVGKNVPTNKICDKIWMFSKLETVYLKDILDPSVVLRQIGRNLTDLRSLTLRHCVVKEENLRNLITVCSKLRYLDIKGCDFHATKFYEELSFLKDLKSVNFSDNSFLTMQNIFSAVVNCKGLEEFHLSIFDPVEKSRILRDEDCIFILSTFTKLKRISLDAVYLSSMTFQLLLGCESLEYLGFYGAQHLTSDIFRRLQPKLPELQALKIRFAYEVNPVDIQYIFMKMPIPKLEELDLTGSKIDDFCLKEIATACPKLKKVILRSCKRVSEVTAILAQCTELELLNIAFCDKLKLHFFVPGNLKVLYVGKSKECLDFVQHLYEINPDLLCKICTSEYNKEAVSFINFK